MFAKGNKLRVGLSPANKLYSTCTKPGCGKPHDSHGLCHTHAESLRRKRNPEKYRLIKKLDYQKHKKENQKKARENRQRNRKIVLGHYSNGTFKCYCCGESQYMFLSVDHLENNGAEHRKQIGSSQLYNWLIKNNFPPGFGVMCYNCNIVKGQYGKCLVHQGEAVMDCARL